MMLLLLTLFAVAAAVTQHDAYPKAHELITHAGLDKRKRIQMRFFEGIFVYRQLLR